MLFVVFVRYAYIRAGTFLVVFLWWGRGWVGGGGTIV